MKKLPLLLLLISLLACQAVKEKQPAEAPVSESQPSFRFAEEIAAFEAADQARPVPAEAIVFAGSSSLRMWKTLVEDLAPYPVVNRGFGGSTMPELIHYADRIVWPYKPKAVFVYEGDNDITSEAVSPDSMLRTFQEFHRLTREQSPDTKIYFISIKPSVARKNLFEKATQTNALVRQYCEANEDLAYVDIVSPMLKPNGTVRSDLFVSDSLHMNETGYEIWTEVIRPLVSAEK
ncbi:MAG: SGNH/GDSL hydrolase family protein [Bacteroidia bacterium]|nr:SGNH/GDSL hydrolase family protein [Bacteroidia bacterium]